MIFKKNEEPADEEPLKVGKILLIIGLLLCAAGIFGVLGLRAGFIQSLLGDAAPYPGVGTAEPMGHIVSVIPIILGVVTIFVWGIKNDPIYYELEKLKGETFGFEEAEEGEIEETLVPEPTVDTPKELKKSPEDVEKDLEKLLEDEPGVPEEESTKEGPELPKKDVKKAPSTIATEYAKAEENRVARCEKMLAAADIYPEDRKLLRYLIPTGISPSEFTEKAMKAIENKKKKESEKDLNSDEKTAMLEKELAAELAELEEELSDDEDDEDIEEMILQEIEEREDL